VIIFPALSIGPDTIVGKNDINARQYLKFFSASILPV
jgi:hypothetical protein